MDNNQRIAANSIVLFARLCITCAISLLCSRFVLQALGASDYGLYNVVGGIVTLLNVLNTSMISTTYRYIAFEMGRGENGNPNKVFNASLAIHISFALIIILIGATVGEWYIANYLNVDPLKHPDAKFVFRISIITTAISTCFVPFRGLLVALEKFLPSSIFEIIANLFKLTGIIFLLYYPGNKLRMYSLVMLAFNALNIMLIYIYSYRKSKQIIRPHFYKDLGLYKEMLSFAGWILFGASASVGKSHGSTIVINYFFGTLVNAAYGVAYQVENFISMFSRTLSQSAVPQITKSFSGGDGNRSVKLTSYISKYTFILMLLVSYPVLLEVDFLLGIWLKAVPEGANLFCKLMIIGGLLGCLGEGIPALVQATGKVKYFQIVLSTIMLLGIPISILCYALGSPAYTILIVYCAISLVNAVVRLALLKKMMKFDVRAFVKTSYWRMFLISCPLVLGYYLYNPSSFTVGQHILGLIVIELFLIICIALLGIDKQEYALLNQYSKPLLKRLGWKK